MWDALRHMAPAIFAFVLSFGIILITWVNHYAAPAVVLYNAVIALQSIGWILVTSTGLRNGLMDSEHAKRAARENRRRGVLAMIFYSLLAIAGFWFPVSTALVTTASWIVWLVVGIRLKPL